MLLLRKPFKMELAIHCITICDGQIMQLDINTFGDRLSLIAISLVNL